MIKEELPVNFRKVAIYSYTNESYLSKKDMEALLERELGSYFAVIVK